MDKIELGQNVKLMMENKAFGITFDLIRQHYKDLWAQTSPNQEELRSTLYDTSVALEDVYRQFKALAVASDNEIYQAEVKDGYDK